MILLYSQGTFPLYEIIKCSARKLQGFSTNAELTLYYHSANIDYIGQKGTLADVLTSKSFLSATSTVQQIEQADGTVKDGSDKYLVMSNAAYAPMQAYLDISFTDNAATAFDTDNNGVTDYYTWTYTVKPVALLSGKFTINAGGSQVSFSKGNLQATTSDNGTNWTWAFATNQWDYIGNSAANNAINGTDTHLNAPQAQRCHQPATVHHCAHRGR